MSMSEQTAERIYFGGPIVTVEDDQPTVEALEAIRSPLVVPNTLCNHRS